MDPLSGKYSNLRRLIHKFQARRDIPFRRKFFVGYDLSGNTYWEFTIDGNMQRLRRKLEPYEKKLFKVDYFAEVPPQWLQWLRRTRPNAPTLEELINDQMRQYKMKVLAELSDQKWRLEKERLHAEQNKKLALELEKTKKKSAPAVDQKGKRTDEASKEAQNSNEDKGEIKTGDQRLQEEEDPWKEADTTKDKNPIQLANISIKRR